MFKSPQNQSNAGVELSLPLSPLQTGPIESVPLNANTTTGFFTKVPTDKKHMASVYFLTVLSNGDVASGDANGQINIWRGAEIHKSFKAHDGAVVSILELPDGRVLTAGRDAKIKIWNPPIGNRGRTLGERLATLTSLTMSADGLIISASMDRSLSVWDLKKSKGKELISSLNHRRAVEPGAVMSMFTLPNGDFVCTSATGEVSIATLEANRQISFRARLAGAQSGHCLTRITPSGELIHGTSTGFTVWDVSERGKEKYIKTIRSSSGVHAHGEILPRGLVVTSFQDKKMMVWNPKKSETMSNTLRNDADSVNSYDLHPNGNLITGDSNGEVLARPLFKSTAADPTVQHPIYLLSLNKFRLDQHLSLFPTNLTSVDFSDTFINDEIVEAVLKRCPNLKTIKVEGCGWVTAKGLKLIADRDPSSDAVKMLVTPKPVPEVVVPDKPRQLPPSKYGNATVSNNETAPVAQPIRQTPFSSLTSSAASPSNNNSASSSVSTITITRALATAEAPKVTEPVKPASVQQPAPAAVKPTVAPAAPVVQPAAIKPVVPPVTAKPAAPQQPAAKPIPAPQQAPVDTAKLQQQLALLGDLSAESVRTLKSLEGVDLEAVLPTLNTFKQDQHNLNDRLNKVEKDAGLDQQTLDEIGAIHGNEALNNYYQAMKTLLSETALAAKVISSGAVNASASNVAAALNGISKAAGAICPPAAPFLGFASFIVGGLDSIRTQQRMRNISGWADLHELPRLASTLARRLTLAQRDRLSTGLDSDDAASLKTLSAKCTGLMDRVYSGQTPTLERKRALLDTEKLLTFMKDNPRTECLSVEECVAVLLPVILGEGYEYKSVVKSGAPVMSNAPEKSSPGATTITQDQFAEMMRMKAEMEAMKAEMEKLKKQTASQHNDSNHSVTADLGNGQVGLYEQSTSQTSNAKNANGAVGKVYLVTEKEWHAQQDLNAQMGQFLSRHGEAASASNPGSMHHGKDRDRNELFDKPKKSSLADSIL